MEFSRQKTTCGTGLRRVAARIAAEFGTHSPQNARTDQIMPDCPKEAFFQNLPKIFEFSPFQKRGANNGQGFFLDRWQTRLPPQFPKREIGETWQWFEMGNHWGGAGTGMVTMRSTKSAAKYRGR